MKKILLLLLSVPLMSAFGQHINGPAIVRDKPDGGKLFSVNDFVAVSVNKRGGSTDWKEIQLNCYVKPDRLIDKKVVKQSTTLLSIDGDSIGFTNSQFQLGENFNEMYRKYDELERINISLKGYTHKSNIRNTISTQEIVDHKLSYADSCQSRYVTYQEENGMYITLIDKCNIYGSSISRNDDGQGVIVRERQRIKRISGAEGQDSHIDLEIVEGLFNEKQTVRRFTAQADKIDIEGKLITVVQYGCCANEDTYKLYNSITFNKLMEYTTTRRHLRIPNSKIEGFIGFLPKYNDERDGVVGTLTLTDGEVVINTVNFVTRDKYKFDNILRRAPEMEFVPINPKDKVNDDKIGIELWSKNFSKSNKDLAGFKFLVRFFDESSDKTYTQELTFTSGGINGKVGKEFDIVID